jgi:hypothetical protein
MRDAIPDSYGEFAKGIFAALQDTTTPITHPIDVAEAVWQAVTDSSAPMRMPAGADAVEWAKAG